MGYSIDFEVTPFTIVVDTREQHPFSFSDFRCDTRRKKKPLVVKTKRAALKTGDYSIVGFESAVAIERKSLDDAFSTFGGDRERWLKELERLAAYECSAVVVEADWTAVLAAVRPPSQSGRQFSPKHFYRSVLSWQQRFPKTHWWFCPTRQFAEHTTYRILERFYSLQVEKLTDAAPRRSRKQKVAEEWMSN